VKLKLDENLPAELATDLRALGHDADTVIDEGLGGAPDPAVLEAARATDRILFTLDKGIANLQRYPLHQHAGVVLFRPDTSGRSAVIAFLRERLDKVFELDLKDRLTVVGPSRIRFR
jgi:predicted nuclease of predicted toxin-antitoxin system